MSKRSEEAAEEYFRGSNPYREHPEEEWKKEGFISGYEQAEQDLALSIKDIELLHAFLYAIKNNKHGCFTFTRLSNEQYEEALRRFRETKNK